MHMMYRIVIVKYEIGLLEATNSGILIIFLIN